MDKGYQATNGIKLYSPYSAEPYNILTATTQTFFRQCLITRTFNPVYRDLLLLLS
nr:MAG TPA: hypothetical protein [Caudoviricetes sp.]